MLWLVFAESCTIMSDLFVCIECLFRNLPLIAASLHGRTHFDYSFFRSRNHMTFYVKMLGLLELLQPHVFRPEHKEALHDALTCYFDMFKVGFLFQNL